MELRHLRYFVAAAEEGHFGRAALRVHIAQPALSIQIQALERELGGKLFARAGRGVALTEAGRLFLVEARQVLEQAERALAQGQRAMRGELGRLAVGYSGSAAYSGILRQAVRPFRQRHPAVELSLQELDPVSQIEALMNRRIQVGFLTTLALELPEAIAVRRLAAWPLQVVLAEDHPLAALPAVPIERLAGEVFISYADSGRQQGAAVLSDFVGFKPRAVLQATNMMMVLAMVGTGQGVGMLPALLRSSAPGAGVVFKPIEGRDFLMDSSLAYWRDEQDAVARAFVEGAEHLFADAQYSPST